MSLKPKRWICCQLGARMHYAIPRLLHAAGSLTRFYTDIYAGQGGWHRLLAAVPQRWCPSEIKRLLGRTAMGMPENLIRTYPAFGLTYYLRRKWARDPVVADHVHLWAGQAFGARVVSDGFGGADAVYAFNTAALEILAAARQRGLFTVLEQTIVPRLIEERLLAEERKRYSGWETGVNASAGAAALAQREQEEWRQADMIVCGSEFVRDGIQKCGGPAERCVLVPYGVDSHFAPSVHERASGRLRVLTIGEVGLRKGAGCALEVAKALPGVAEFRWVGAISLRDPARAEMARHIELTGAVARNDIMDHYAWADVFFLPSICEGSATVTYEALACGLPVLTTPNSGSPVQNGVNGFIVPIHDVPAMAERLAQLHRDRAWLAEMGKAAAVHAKNLSLEAYQKRFLRLLIPPAE